MPVWLFGRFLSCPWFSAEKSSIPMEHFTVPLILFVYALTDFSMSEYFLCWVTISMLFLAHVKPTLVVVIHALLENVAYPFGDGCTWLCLSIGVFHLSEAKPWNSSAPHPTFVWLLYHIIAQVLRTKLWECPKSLKHFTLHGAGVGVCVGAGLGVPNPSPTLPPTQVCNFAR